MSDYTRKAMAEARHQMHNYRSPILAQSDAGPGPGARSATALAERFGSHGREIEQVEFTVSPLGANVYIHIESTKRTQNFRMTEHGWRKLIRAGAK